MSHPAPDIITLYRFEDQIEQAVVDFLTVRSDSVGNPLKVYRTRDTTEKDATPWVEVSLTMGEATQHYYIDSTGKAWPDVYEGSLEFDVYTNRTADNAEEDGAYIRAMIRMLMGYFQGTFNSDTNDAHYHTVQEMIETGTAPEMDEGNNLDHSRMSFRCRIAIKTECWPSDNFTG